MTYEEIGLYFNMTRARIRAIEEKALRRLAMTDEEKEIKRSLKLIEKDPALKEFFAILLIATS